MSPAAPGQFCQSVRLSPSVGADWSCTSTSQSCRMHDNLYTKQSVRVRSHALAEATMRTLPMRNANTSDTWERHQRQCAQPCCRDCPFQIICVDAFRAGHDHAPRFEVLFRLQHLTPWCTRGRDIAQTTMKLPQWPKYPTIGNNVATAFLFLAGAPRRKMHNRHKGYFACWALAM